MYPEKHQNRIFEQVVVKQQQIHQYFRLIFEYDTQMNNARKLRLYQQNDFQGIVKLVHKYH